MRQKSVGNSVPDQLVACVSRSNYLHNDQKGPCTLLHLPKQQQLPSHLHASKFGSDFDNI